MSLDDADTQYLEPQDFGRRLRAIAHSELMRIYKKARLRVWKTGMEPADLVHEAIARTLAGERSCRADDEVIKHLDGVMRSIAETEREKRDREIHEAPMDSESTDTPAVVAASAQTGDLTARHAHVAESLKRVEDAFAGDPQAEAVVVGLANQWSPAEMQEVGQMDETQYQSARRRVRRTLERRFREENDDDG